MNEPLPVISEVERELAATMPEEQVRAIRALARRVVAVADEVAEEIGKICGPNPGPLAGLLKAQVQMGAGYFRTVADTISRLFRERAALTQKGDR